MMSHGVEDAMEWVEADGVIEMIMGDLIPRSGTMQRRGCVAVAFILANVICD